MTVNPGPLELFVDMRKTSQQGLHAALRRRLLALAEEVFQLLIIQRIDFSKGEATGNKGFQVTLNGIA